MGKKSKKKSKNNNELQKQEKLKKKELKKNKIDKVNFAVIISLMILLPLWQLVRMQFAGIDRIDLYQKCHCGYILWVAGSILLVTYIINLVKKRTKIDKIDIIMYAFSLVILISTLLADDKNLAFFGIVDRYEGIFSLLSYNILILTVKNLPLKNRYITIINTFMALGLVQSLIAIIQCFVRSDYILRFSYPFMANALCGNPNYLGSYMMILTILSMAMYLFSEKYNRMYFAFTLIFIFTLVLAQSTTPLLGVAVGTLFLLIYNFTKHRDLFKKTLLISFVSAIVALISIYGTVYIYTDIYHMRVYKNYTIKSDITQMFNRVFGLEDDDSEYFKNIEGVTPENQDSLITDQSFYSSRLFIWNISGKIISDRFFFGCGPDNFALNFQKHSTLYVDRAHNVYIHIFATLGLFGFVCYMALLINTFIKGIFSKNKITIVCLAVFMAYVIQAFFSVNVIEVLPYFYILLGIILATYDKEERIYS